MGPSGAIWVERSASRPCSQSLSGFGATSSWAQAIASATKERIAICFSMTELLRIRASKKTVHQNRSPKLQRRQQGSLDGVEQRSLAALRVDGPGHFQDRADALLPGDVEVVEEPLRAGEGIDPPGRSARGRAGRFQAERLAQEASGEAERRNALGARAGEREARELRRIERHERAIVLGADGDDGLAPAGNERAVLLADRDVADEKGERVEIPRPAQRGRLRRVDAQGQGERRGRPRGDVHRLVEGAGTARGERRKSEESSHAVEGIAVGGVLLAMGPEEDEQLFSGHAALPRDSAAAVASRSAWVFAASVCRRCACVSVTARRLFKVRSSTSSGSPPRASMASKSRRRAARTMIGPTSIGKVPPTMRK